MKSFKEIIKSGGIAVMRTDTLYGIVADAHNENSVKRIYVVKNRDLLKPVIVLIADFSDLKKFGIVLTVRLKERLQKYWPGKVSIVLKPEQALNDTHYIHKGTQGIAFRMPGDENLRNLLRDVGPLVAPSANPEGLPPAKNIQEATDYFGDSVDYYLDGGQVTNTKPSKIIKIINGFSEEVIRS